MDARKQQMRGLVTGARKHPWEAFISGFAAFSVMWTLTEACSYFLPFFDLKGIGPILAVILISLIYAAIRVWQP